MPFQGPPAAADAPAATLRVKFWPEPSKWDDRRRSPAQQHIADAIRRRRDRPCGRQIYLRPSVVDDLRGREYLKPGHLHAGCHRVVIMKPCVELGDCVCGNSASFLYQLLGGIT